jgi:hypothetical protein
MISEKTVLCVCLTAEALAHVHSIAKEQGKSLAAVGRKYIEDGLRAEGRHVPEYTPFEGLRRPRKRAA